MIWKDRLKARKALSEEEIYQKSLELSGKRETKRTRPKYDQSKGHVYPFKKKAIRRVVSERLHPAPTPL